jgi:hypothetical protein
LQTKVSHIVEKAAIQQLSRQFLSCELIAKPPGNIVRQYAIIEKCGYGVRVSGKAGGFAIFKISEYSLI